MRSTLLLILIGFITLFVEVSNAYSNSLNNEASQVQQSVPFCKELPFGAGFEDNADLAAKRWEKHELSIRKADVFFKVIGNVIGVGILYLTREHLSLALWKFTALMKENSIIAAKDIGSNTFRLGKLFFKRLPIVLLFSIILHTEDDPNSEATLAGYYLNHFDKFIDLYFNEEKPLSNEYVLGFLLQDSFQEYEDFQFKKLRERVFEYMPGLKDEYIVLKEEIDLEIFMKKQDQQELQLEIERLKKKNRPEQIFIDITP